MSEHGDPGGAQVEPVTSPLLRAKLRPPTVPDHYVRRTRLLHLVDEAVRAPLTVVRAPAGTGKTVLLSGWTAEREMPLSWLSLDESDHDASQLWPNMIAALEQLAPQCGGRALTLVRRSAALPDAVGQLLDDLHEGDHAPSILVIDDVQYVDVDESVAASLALFVQHLPDWMHVVLLARREPRLPLDRMRARGTLGEVTFADLSFSSAEAREMLARLVPSLPRERIDATAAHAEGWAAGLQLAALAARSTGVRSDVETGSTVEADHLIQDYVWRDVLAGEDGELVDTLLDVAVVDRIDPSLARALTGRDDADRLLRLAEARGLFVARRGPEGWFDLHALVRAALVAELRRRAPERLAERHVRAARWHQGVGATGAAIKHWLLAGRPRDALQLVAATVAGLYDNGDQATIQRTIAAIPLDIAATDLEAMQDFAWCHIVVDRRRFIELVDGTMWWADRSTVDKPLLGRLTTLRSIAATLSGRWVDGGDLARRGMREMGDNWWRDPIGRFGWNMVARELALSERWDEASAEVREAEHMLGRLPERRLAFEGTRALGEALAGRPTDALRITAGIRRASEITNMTILRTELAIAEALALREIGDAARALPMLEALAEATPEPMLYCRVLAQLELSQARLDEGDVGGARELFDRTEALVCAESFEGGGRDWLTRSAVRIALADGQIDQARHGADQVGDPFWRGICAARVQLAVGHRPGAVQALDPLVARCVRHEVVLNLLRASAVDDHEVATKAATAAVDLAATNGLVQTVASEGPDVVELVEHAAWRVPAQWMDRLRRLATERRSSAAVGRPQLVEPLTERERDVLRFLPSRLTVPEIADELYLSVNTLKFHLKAIYRKLGVGSRREAAQVARRMTLI